MTRQLDRAATAVFPPPGSRWRDARGAAVEVVCTAVRGEDRSDVVVFRAANTGQVWVRLLGEFLDGRFARLPDPPRAAFDADACEGE